jgi:lipoate---protein ligase
MKSFSLVENKIRRVHWNLALEEALALSLSSEDYSMGLRFWKNQNSIVLGISDYVTSNIPKEIIDSFLENHSFQKNKLVITEIARRASGGGTVFHDEENLNYSLFVNTKHFPEYYPVENSYKFLLEFIIQSLRKQNIKSVQAGKSDISVMTENGLKKISGNSQFRKKNILVLHGTLILDKKLISKVKTILNHPPEEPEYRKGRVHEDFLTSLPENFSTSQFSSDLGEIFFRELSKGNSKPKQNNLSLLRKMIPLANELYQTKYANKDFIFSRK